MISKMRLNFRGFLNLSRANFTSGSSSMLVSTGEICDRLGLPHCKQHEWNAWILLGIGILLLVTNTRNFGVFVYLLRHHWVNTDFICLAIAGLNSLFAIGVIVKTVLRDLPNLWLFNQFEVNFIGAIQKYYLIVYSQLLAFMAIEILVAVRWPFVHRVRYSPKRTVRMVLLCLLIDVPLSNLHFLYGYWSTLEFVPEVLSVSANSSTTAGTVYTYELLLHTGVPCVLVLVCSILTIQSLRRAFLSHNELNNTNGSISATELQPLSLRHRKISASLDAISKISEITLKGAPRGNHRGSVILLSSTACAINTSKEFSKKPSLPHIAVPETSKTRYSENLKLRGNRQQHFGKSNLLTMLFMVRFAVLYLGAFLLTALVCWVLDLREVAWTNLPTTTTTPTLYPVRGTTSFNLDRIVTMPSVSTKARMSTFAEGVGMAGEEEEEDEGYAVLSSLASLSHSEPDPDQHVRTLGILRGRIVFYSVYLIGIEDSLLYFWCNARFRRVHVRCWNAFRNVFRCYQKGTIDGRLHGGESIPFSHTF